VKELAVKQVAVRSLHNAPWNANRVPEDVLAKIRHSIEEFGIVENLVARKRDGGGYEVISGNHRLVLYREMGIDKAPVHVVDVDDSHARVLAQVLNRTQGADDPTAYARLLEDVLSELSIDDVLSFLPETQASISQVLDDLVEPTGGDADDAPALPEGEPESREGEVYELGPHRLICGDCTDHAVMQMLMQGDEASMLFADPPYGVSYVESMKQRGQKTKHRAIANDSLSLEEMARLWAGAWKAAHTVIRPGSAYYVSGPQGGDLLVHLMLSLERSGFPLRHMIIWAKDRFVLGRSDYHYQHEPIIHGEAGEAAVDSDADAEPLLYGWIDGTHRFYGGRKQTSLWQINRPSKAELHPTMKPVELLERCIKNSTVRDEIVLDPFGGSGTTLIAADRLGRRARLVELDPRYCDVIRKRYAGQQS
jgi:site-specific DNA-methyltransferase (adenine-specific)